MFGVKIPDPPCKVNRPGAQCFYNQILSAVGVGSDPLVQWCRKVGYKRYVCYLCRLHPNGYVR